MSRVLPFILIAAACAPTADVERADPDALAFFAGSPVLTHDPIVAGGAAVLTVTGANAFENVYFVASRTAGPGPCPGLLGGLCIDVTSPKLLGSVAADATGTAQLPFNLPGSIVAGTQLAFQAAIPRGVGGVSSVKTSVSIATVAAPGGLDVDGDGYDVSVDCDDSDPSVHPGATEICDGVDTDCDPATTELGLITANGAVNYTSLADATTFTPGGSVIDVCPGVYAASIVITSDLTLQGMGAPGDVVIDAVGAGSRAIDITSTADGAVLRNLTLDGADGDYGIYIDASVALDEVVVTHSDVTVAPVWFNGWAGELAVTDSEISNNVGGESGGIYLNDDALIERSAFLSNTVTSGMGSALSVGTLSSVVEIVDSVVEGNTADVDGGAIWSDHTLGTAGNALTVLSTDFGAGPTENLPADVHLDFNGTDYQAFQAGASFTCTYSYCY